MSNNVLIQGIGLTKRFGGMTAVNCVDFELRDGEILGLIGPNGAGKSTLFNLISGFIPTDSGETAFLGKKITGLTPNKVCHLGLGRTFQAAKNFPDMSLRENVRMGALFGVPDQTYAKAETETDEIIAYIGLGKYAGTAVPDIPLAGQKQIEVARALATKPKVLLLDELMAGLNPAEVDEAMALVKKIRGTGVTVLLIEHVMKAIMNICDRIIVLHHGALIAEGTPEQIGSNKEVIEIYLGEV
ncbi:MAG: ABC transporter ATP-binding protein [Clostridiales Family XIII bacterium]|jgi:branched-chain amino acid transport system ATP-binding protein|nr:ABC transporter ATP-binding protein [Clostridiales Family XIII bacterium]